MRFWRVIFSKVSFSKIRRGSVVLSSIVRSLRLMSSSFSMVVWIMVGRLCIVLYLSY